MKAKLVLSVLVLVLAATTFGAGEITWNFEGADALGWYNGWGTSSISDLNATTPTHSLKVEKGGWGTAFCMNTDAAVKNALATVGTIKLDVTTDAATFSGNNWGDVGVYMQGGGSTISSYWGIGNWAGGLVVGTTQSMTLQLTTAQMAQVAGSNWWFELGIGVNAPNATPAELDPITGEVITPAITPTFYFDNVQIVPEPATLALLGLGALATLKRRKA
jgi:hypothetical protein